VDVLSTFPGRRPRPAARKATAQAPVSAYAGRIHSFHDTTDNLYPQQHILRKIQRRTFGQRLEHVTISGLGARRLATEAFEPIDHVGPLALHNNRKTRPKPPRQESPPQTCAVSLIRRFIQAVEPVFGQIKAILGRRSYLRLGLEAAQSE